MLLFYMQFDIDSFQIFKIDIAIVHTFYIIILNI